MKKTLLLLCMLSALFFGEAQQPDFLFEYPYPYPLLHWPYENPVTVLLEVEPNGTTEGFYFLSVSEGKQIELYESDPVFLPVLYKVSNTGEVLDELTLGYADHFTSISRLYHDPNDANCCIALGRIYDVELHYEKPFMAKFSHDMDLLWQREIELPEPCQKCLSTCYYLDSEGEILCFSIPHFNDPSVFYHSAYFYRLSTEGELGAVFYEYPYVCSQFSGTLFEYQDGSGDYGIVTWEENDERFLVRLNRDLELIGHYPIPLNVREESVDYTYLLSIDLVGVSLPQKDGSIIIGGDGSLFRITTYYDTYDEVIGYMKLADNGEVTDYWSVGQGDPEVGNDSIKAMRGYKNADQVGDDAFYSYYMVGERYGFGYDWIDHLAIVKMDFEGNLIWRRYWNRYFPEYGMKVYWPSIISATADGGGLLAGYCYESDSSEPDVFILKFFADGSLAVPEMESSFRPYAYWPNPAKDLLNLQYSPDITPTKIELFDLQGRLVLSQDSAFESLDVAGLSAGTYTMRITMENGKMFSDKVVKE